MGTEFEQGVRRLAIEQAEDAYRLGVVEAKIKTVLNNAMLIGGSVWPNTDDTPPPILTAACPNPIPFTLNIREVDKSLIGTATYRGFNSPTWDIARFPSFHNCHLWAGSLNMTVPVHSTCASVISDIVYVLYINTSGVASLSRMLQTAATSPFCTVSFTFSGSPPNAYEGDHVSSPTACSPFSISNAWSSRVYSDVLNHQVDFYE
jgi:hypothetical protein